MSSLELEPIFGSVWLVVALVVTATGLLLLVRATGRSLSNRQQQVLMGFRLAALVLLCIALLRPAWVRTDAQPAPATLPVLVDLSRSMTLADTAEASRWETQRRVLEELAPALAAMDEQLQVRFYGYGETAQTFDHQQLAAQQPTLPRTDLAAALRAALAGASGQPLAGVILSGDGTTTVADSNPGAVARTLRSLDVPLWTIPIGPRQGDQARDLAIQQLPEEYSVFSKNVFRISAVLKARGLVGKNLDVRVSLVDEEGQREEVATRVLVANASDATLPIDIELAAPQPGNYRLEVRAEPQPGETLTDNNQQIAFLDVREGGGRVLYLEGQLYWEQEFVRRAIKSRDLALEFSWIDINSQPRWPIDLTSLLQPNRFDVIIIGDLHATALGTENLQAIAKNVELGAGLLMLGGQHTFDAGGYAGTPLAAVLPITLQEPLAVSPTQDPPASTKLAGPIRLRPRQPHPITQLTQAGSNLELWSQLQPLLGAYRFSGVKVNPTVEVLLESTDQQPLLVIGGYRSGRVATFAGDSTWRWAMEGQGDIHRRFWRQLILWLLARDAPDADAIWIEMDSRRFPKDQPASFTTGIQSLDDGQSKTTLVAEVIDEDGTTTPVPLRPAPPQTSNQQRYPATALGALPELAGGLYRLRVSPADENSPTKPAELVFQVVNTDAELSQPIAEVARLEQLAEITAEAGGRAYRTDEIAQLIDDARKLRREAELPIVERKRLGDDPWSGWLLMLLMTGLLSAEWYCRRKWGLA